MKKILFILFAALAFIACDKENQEENLSNLLYDNSGYVKLSQDYVFFDKEKGGTITIEAEEDAYVDGISRQVGTKLDSEVFYDITPPDYVVTLDQILEYKEFTTPGLKVIPNGFRKFTIIVEPNCGYDLYHVGIVKIVETKKYGKVGGRGGNSFQVVLQ